MVSREIAPVWDAMRQIARRPFALMRRKLISTSLLCVSWLGGPTARALVLGAILSVSAPVSNAASPDPLAVAFGTMPALWGVRMSPDGTKVSFLQMHPEDLPILRVFDLTTGEANLALASARDRFDLQWCDWANDERLLCSFFGISKAEGRFFVTAWSR